MDSALLAAAPRDQGQEINMNNGQAFAKLMKIQRANKDLEGDCEDLMQYITELAAAAKLAESNLFEAACGRTENIRHNHGVVSGKLDKLIMQPPSHGGDI